MNETPPPLPSKRHSGTAADQKTMRMLLPVGRSGWAIAAGYLGLISVLILPAPFALVVSLVAIRDLKKNNTPETKKYGMGRAIFGLVMGIIGSIVLALAATGLLLDLFEQ